MRDWKRLELSGDLDNPGREFVDALCSLVRRLEYGRQERILLRMMAWCGLFGSVGMIAMLVTGLRFPFLAGIVPFPCFILASYGETRLLRRVARTLASAPNPNTVGAMSTFLDYPGWQLRYAIMAALRDSLSECTDEQLHALEPEERARLYAAATRFSSVEFRLAVIDLAARLMDTDAIKLIRRLASDHRSANIKVTTAASVLLPILEFKLAAEAAGGVLLRPAGSCGSTELLRPATSVSRESALLTPVESNQNPKEVPSVHQVP
jgi:hypothetical protein